MLFETPTSIKSGYLPVSSLHIMHYETSGNPNGVKFLFLHGGPGGGISSSFHRFFPSDKAFTVTFDQRGCGKSTPYGEVKENTTDHLIEDIEKLRKHLGIESWIVSGGSWGSTLALAYAIKHPTVVKGLILRGIFLLRKSDIQWFYQDGASHVFPDQWEAYKQFIPVSERKDFLYAYYKRIHGIDRETAIKASSIWSKWEGSTIYHTLNPTAADQFSQPEFAVAFAKLETHYFMNRGFFPTDNYLLEQAHKIKHIPMHIIHGRYDMCTPMDNAWDLYNALDRQPQLTICPNSGHSSQEPEIIEAIMQAGKTLGGY